MGDINFGILLYKGMVYMSLITFSVPSVVCCALRFLVDSSVRRDPSSTRCTKRNRQDSCYAQDPVITN